MCVSMVVGAIAGGGGGGGEGLKNMPAPPEVTPIVGAGQRQPMGLPPRELGPVGDRNELARQILGRG